jgi:multidrug efflux system membrane fusion protein
MTADHPPAPTSPRRRPRWVAWLVVLAIAALVAFIWQSTHKSGPGAGGGGRRGAAADQAVPVLVGTVRSADMPVKLRAVGTVEAEESVAVRAQASGEVLAVGFTEGQPVTKGQVLYRLDAAPLEASLRQAQAALARDQAQLAQARADAARFRSLVAQGYVSRQQAEQTASSAAALEATVQADRALVENARVQLAFATIKSPINGVAGERMVDVGNLVRAGDTNPLVTIHRVSPALVAFSIPQNDIDRVRRFQREKPIQVTATPRGGRPQVGTVVFIDNAVDASTGTLRLRARFANRDGAFVPGQFADVDITLTTERGRIVAPAQSILPGQEGHFAYVVNDDNTVSQRAVKLERAAGEDAVIASGLSPGERVVTDGTLQLRDGAKIELRETLIPPSPPARRGRGGQGQGRGAGQGGH